MAEQAAGPDGRRMLSTSRVVFPVIAAAAPMAAMVGHDVDLVLLAQLIVMDLRSRETGAHRSELRELKRSDRPDLRGGVQYVDSPRHVSYVEIHAYTAYLAGLRDRFGWPDLDENSYAARRTDAVPALS
jgi:hypothetical protein